MCVLQFTFVQDVEAFARLAGLKPVSEGRARGEDALAEADATFVLMMMTFAEFLPALYDALGGEEVPASI